MKFLILLVLFTALCATVFGAPKRQSQIASECLLPQDGGRCTGYYPAYYYNTINKKCEIFDYTGCDGNGNRFATKAACESRCY